MSKYPTLCVGFNIPLGTCKNQTGKVSGEGRKNPYWCPKCDAERITTISGQFEEIQRGFNR